MTNQMLGTLPTRNMRCTSYSLPSYLHCVNTLWPRHMERIEKHYSSLSINTLFKSNPKLEEYLREKYDGDIVGEVSHLSHISMSLGLAC